MVLKHNRYFVESQFPEVLQMLLKDPVIQECRLRRDQIDPTTTVPDGTTISEDGLISQVQTKQTLPQFGSKPEQSATVPATVTGEGAAVPEDITNFYDKIDKDDDDEEQDTVLNTVSFEVNQVSSLALQ
jgi:DNA excision repair protein ERCC-3